MGREAVAFCSWNGRSAHTKVLLEANGLILRGEIRDTIRRDEISQIVAKGDTLHLVARGKPLSLEFAAGQADRWAVAIAKPVPTLAEKMGLARNAPALVIGANSDGALEGALRGQTTANPDEARMIVAIISSDGDFEAALHQSGKRPSLPVWCVQKKGKGAVLNEDAIRALMRSNGYIDNKSCSVSEKLSATRYTRAGSRERA